MKHALLLFVSGLVACGPAASPSAAPADVAATDAALADAAPAPDTASQADVTAQDTGSFEDTQPDAGQPPADVSPQDLPGFDAPELLGRPTDQSVSLNLVPSTPVEIYVEFGPNSSFGQQTPPSTREAHKPAVVKLEGLGADQAYQYRVRWRQPGEASYQSGPTRSFHTQRKPGQTFRFTVQSDPHMDENTTEAQYLRTLTNVLGDAPDFHIDLGDTFMCEKHAGPFTTVVKSAGDAATVDKRYLYERDHFGVIAHSVPLFLVNGNHEGEFGYAATPSGNDVPTWATLARQTFYLPPLPDGFYTGDTQQYPNVGQRGAWYAWQWGDALFVALDPFWHMPAKGGKDGWAITLGKAQYDWLTATLAGSKAKWKFVFLHNLVGGLDGAMRGGVEAAPFFEWGGANVDGSPGFAAKRPGWAKPIHALLVEHKVTAVFHGHDHLYVHQVLDGVVYQEVPQPSAKNTKNGAQLAKDYHYDSGTAVGSAGHVRITVQPDGVVGEYVRAWLPNAGKNGEIAHSWTVAPK